MSTPDEEAMVHVIEQLAPDPGRQIAGILLFMSRKVPGVTVRIDWPTFLGKTPHEVEAAYRRRAGHDMPDWNPAASPARPTSGRGAGPGTWRGGNGNGRR